MSLATRCSFPPALGLEALSRVGLNLALILVLNPTLTPTPTLATALTEEIGEIPE